MKTKILFSAMIVIAWFSLSTAMANPENQKSPGSVAIVTTADLYDLSSVWVAAYQMQHPGRVVNVIRYTRENRPEILNAGAGLCIVSDDFYTSLSGENLWKMVIGRDAIVPAISTKNPRLAEIQHKGMSMEQLAEIIRNPGTAQGKDLTGGTQKTSVHLYLLNEPSMNERVAKCLGVPVAGLNATMVNSAAELADIIQKDPLALGFCRLANVLDQTKQALIPGIALLPIDKNGNGKLDPFENIYASIPEFLHGVWLGKYPGSLTLNIYALAAVQPENENEVAFLQWVLAAGQQYLNQHGYFDLGYNEREAKSALLGKSITLAAIPTRTNPLQTIMILLAALLLAGSAIVWMIKIQRNKKTSAGRSIHGVAHFNAGTLNIPKGLWFDKSHTWAFMEQNGMVRMGIDDFLQHLTGPVSRVKMMAPGTRVLKGEVILTVIQNGKQLNIHAPVSGIIRTQNGLLGTHASMINQAPFTDGWVYTIEPSNWLRETQFLFMAERYQVWLKQEFIRARDFFATATRSLQGEYIPIVLQDGGELQDNVLSTFGPEVWEEFQQKFIDESI